ncbi:MAG: MarC family protein [Bacteroidales bacterium]|nr:MarC family protein [Bacteroidales bacterium]MBN2763014.1 MarC family protein [Bacteroidales bacterium]
MAFRFVDIVTVFMVLFAVIDITGSIPIIIDIKRKTGHIDAERATLVSFMLMLLFLFAGELFLNLFGVDVSSFAIAGSIVLLLLGIEMVLGIEVFKYESNKQSSIVPLAFPLIAGAGTMTTILSLKAVYSVWTILIALSLNMIIVYIVLKATRLVEKLLGTTGILILKKIFGIILLAIAIKLFLSTTGIQLNRVS